MRAVMSALAMSIAGALVGLGFGRDGTEALALAAAGSLVASALNFIASQLADAVRQ